MCTGSVQCIVSTQHHCEELINSCHCVHTVQYSTYWNTLEALCSKVALLSLATLNKQ